MKPLLGCCVVVFRLGCGIFGVLDALFPCLPFPALWPEPARRRVVPAVSVGDRFELPVGRLPVSLRRRGSGPVRRELNSIRGRACCRGFQFRLPLRPVALQGVEIHGEQAALGVFHRRPFARSLVPAPLGRRPAP